MRFQINWICLALLLSTPVFAVERVFPKLQGVWSSSVFPTRFKVANANFTEFGAKNPNVPLQKGAIRYPFGESFAVVTFENGEWRKIYSAGEDTVAVESFNNKGNSIGDGIIFFRHGKKDQINSDKSLQSAEQAYMNAIKGVAEEYERNLVDLKDLRNGDLAEADQINEQIKKIRLEIERLEQWPKLEKTTWDMWVEGGVKIKRDFWSDGKVFSTEPYKKWVEIPADNNTAWRSFTESGEQKRQLIPARGHFIDTYVVSEDGKTLTGKNQDGTRVYGERVGEPVFEKRKPVGESSAD